MASAATPRTSELPLGPGLSRLGFWLLGYTVFVLLFGALVRVTGSGAGCGQHWPTCQGEVLHLPRSLETTLEFTHRVTSGLVLVFGFAYAFLLSRLPRGHRAKRALWLGLGFTLIDALIGAALVLFALVGQNTSALRALVMPAHLVSTCGLSAGFALAAFWANERAPAPRPPLAPARRYALFGLLGFFVVVAGMGAVTALGDTLYPVSAASLVGRVGEDLGDASHFLQRLRVVHPVLAAVFGLTVTFGVPRLVQASGDLAQRFAGWRVALSLLELALGIVNVLLSAPGWMQLIHLGVAIALWLALVLCTAEALAPRQAAARATAIFESAVP